MGNVFKEFLKYVKRSRLLNEIHNEKKAVVITGCDSGLGFSLSMKLNQFGLTVISGCLNSSSEGANILKNVCHVFELDVTDSKSIQNFAENVNYLTTNKGVELHSVINNAGIMIFGEFGWYTEQQILSQVQVNILGSFLIAKAFLPILRKNKGRLINITSHCALTNLPTLSVYGATKAAVQSWSDGLRMEEQKYGVKVITFIPGSFVSQSSIMTKQKVHFQQMKDSFTKNEIKVPNHYFERLSTYLVQAFEEEEKPLSPIKDQLLYKKFMKALLDENPNPNYKHETWRYFFFYNFFRLPFIKFRHFLIWKFLKFPGMNKKL